MSVVQHEGAEALPQIIERYGAHSGKLTYSSAAEKMQIAHPGPRA
jgi:hypothetical protein